MWKNYFSKLIEAKKKDVKGTWKILNDIISKKSSACDFPDAFVDENKVVTDPYEIANGFNHFFINVGPSLAANIPLCEGNICDYLGEKQANSMYLTPISDSEVLNVVKSLSKKTSLDHNGISMEIIKKVIPNIVKPFAYFCNKSFLDGYFPDSMKIARVIPIYKSGEKCRYTNYRPVSLLSQFSKILEKLFETRFTNFIEKNEILSNSQYGFRSNRSTTMALIELTEEITNSIENELSTVGIFIDLRKAFWYHRQ